MDNSIEKIISTAEQEAKKLIAATAGIRNSFTVGRPNSSKESTVEGTLRALEVILNEAPKQG